MPNDLQARALALWEEGTRALLQGEVAAAIDLFTRSVETAPTAEGYSFRGWAYSYLGRWHDAIAECKRAIEIDPTLGNPYNDIGSYLVKLGEEDEAIAWFDKAKRSTRYEPRHFPYLNLGRLYYGRGDVAEAILEFDMALRLNPGDAVALDFLERLKLKIN